MPRRKSTPIALPDQVTSQENKDTVPAGSSGKVRRDSKPALLE